jgi:uncharacterized protein (DUF885 family)
MFRPLALALTLHAAALLSLPLAGQAQNPASTAPAAAAAKNDKAAPAQALAALAERYYEAQARFEPLNATFFGDNRFDDKLPMTIVPAVRARQYAMLHEVRNDLARIDRSRLSPADLITYDVLAHEINTLISFEPLKDYLLPMNQMDSMPVTLANLASGTGSQPIATVAQYEAFLQRLSALPEWIDAAMANMRTGMRQGIVLPRPLTASLLPQIQALARKDVKDSEFTAPLRRFPDGFSKGERARFNGRYNNVVGNRVLPAVRRLARFLEQEYLPASRATAGWDALPGGPSWYRTWVAAQTTTSMSPEEIHQLGLSEMARLRSEFIKVGARLGYQGDPAGLGRWLAAQPKYRPFKTEAEVLDAYRALNARITPLMPKLFASLPKAPLEIRPEPELSRETASDHYTLSAADGSRPGIFWAVINDPAQYGSTRMTSLFLHEGQPGHHFQLSKQQELDIPKFRKLGAITAYVEGWALYAEGLGKELGLYEDPNAYAGNLILDMRRAARLVVDTGLHAKGWTREQTIRFLMEQAGDSEEDAKNATERYMAWPGQALAYKIGALKIMELRQRASAKLGPRFDLARFHDAILANGSMPLSLLETHMNQWIEAQAASAAPASPAPAAPPATPGASGTSAHSAAPAMAH